jgi:hypothetical protein
MELYDYVNVAKPTTPPGHHTNVIAGLGTVFRDIYPYSPEDSFLWMELFQIACSMNYANMASMLAYLRNVGARLVPDDQFGFVVQPVIDITGFRGWKSQADYDREKKCLTEPVDYTQVLITALIELRKRYQAGKITAVGG